MTATATAEEVWYREPRIGELFAGYGGLGMGVQAVLGGRVVWYSEIDRGALKVLGHRFPGTPNLGDVSTVDWSGVEPVEILTGGFPCQDVSSAGKRAGLMHGTRSGLWHEFARAIAALRPPVVVIENVRGLLTARGDTSAEYEAAEDRLRLIANLMEHVDLRRAHAVNQGRTADVRRLTTRSHRLMGLHRGAVAALRRAERRIVRAIGTVLGTLADLGYDAGWYGLRAADIGAPHGRFRVFIVATDAQHHGPHRGEVGRGPGTSEVEGRLLEPQGSPSVPLLGTPRAADGMSHPLRDPEAIGNPQGRLEDQIALLPTPTLGGHGVTEEVAARRRAEHSRGGSLDEAVRLLPTPRAEERMQQNSADQGEALSRAVTHLLPTPSVADGTGGHANRSGERSNELLLPGVAEAVGTGKLLPTPRAGDGDKGGPNQRGSSGDLMLPSAVAQLLPTPIVSDANGSALDYRGTEALGEHPVQLRDVAHLLPTPLTTDVSRSDDPEESGRRQLSDVVPMLLPTPTASDPSSGMTPEEFDAWCEVMKDKHGNGNGHGKSLSIEAKRLLPTPKASNNENRTSPGYRPGVGRQLVEDGLTVPEVTGWGPYADAIRRWEGITSPAPPPTEVGANGRARLSPRFSEWMMGLPPGWITDVPDVSRAEALKLAGNGVVPQQAAVAVHRVLTIMATPIGAPVPVPVVDTALPDEADDE